MLRTPSVCELGWMMPLLLFLLLLSLLFCWNMIVQLEGNLGNLLPTCRPSDVFNYGVWALHCLGEAVTVEMPA